MPCEGCAKQTRTKAIAFLSGAERREYLTWITTDHNKDAMELIAMGMKRIQSEIVICHRCEARCIFRLEGGNGFKKYQDIILCIKCFEIIIRSKGYFCSSCLQILVPGATQSYSVVNNQKFRGEFYLCVKCMPPIPGQEGLRVFDIVSFLGGVTYVPDLLRVGGNVN